MAEIEVTLLQVVALTLPALAILMQAMLQLRPDASDGGPRLHTEYRFIELSFVLLVLSASFFSFQIAQSVVSNVVFFGLLVMTLAFLFVIPAMAFSLRRGMTETTPEDALIATWGYQRFKYLRYTIAILGFLAFGIYLYYTPASTTLNFALIAFAVTGAAILVIQYVNQIVDMRAEDEQIDMWESSLLKKTEDVKSLLTGPESQTHSFLSDPSFRGPLLDRLESCYGKLDDAPEIYAEEFAENSRNLANSLAALRELYDRHREILGSIDDLEQEIEDIRQIEGESVQKRISKVQTQMERAESLQEQERLRSELDWLQGKKSEIQDSISTKRNRMAVLRKEKEDIEESVTKTLGEIDQIISDVTEALTE